MQSRFWGCHERARKKQWGRARIEEKAACSRGGRGSGGRPRRPGALHRRALPSEAGNGAKELQGEFCRFCHVGRLQGRFWDVWGCHPAVSKPCKEGQKYWRRGFCRFWHVGRLQGRQSSTPKVVPGAALPGLELGRVGGFCIFFLFVCPRVFFEGLTALKLFCSRRRIQVPDLPRYDLKFQDRTHCCWLIWLGLINGRRIYLILLNNWYVCLTVCRFMAIQLFTQTLNWPNSRFAVSETNLQCKLHDGFAAELNPSAAHVRMNSCPGSTSHLAPSLLVAKNCYCRDFGEIKCAVTTSEHLALGTHSFLNSDRDEKS